MNSALFIREAIRVIGIVFVIILLSFAAIAVDPSQFSKISGNPVKDRRKRIPFHSLSDMKKSIPRVGLRFANNSNTTVSDKKISSILYAIHGNPPSRCESQ
jgi:hypothetical protein